MSMTPEEFVKSSKYLPSMLRDFHDQKDFFKLMHRRQGDLAYEGETVNWRLGHVYVIDHFLWFAAKYGLTLQVSRSNVDFRDLAAHLDEKRKEDAELFRYALRNRNQDDPSVFVYEG